MPTQRIEEQVGQLAIESELNAIDAQWDRERETYMITGNNGVKKLPTVAGSVVGGVIVVVFGIFWTAPAASMGGGGFAAFGVLFILFGIGVSAYSYGKAQAYLAAERRYRRRRSATINRTGKS